LVNNGTLIGNWYEEEELRNKTGAARTIPGKHIPKKTMDFDTQITSEYPRNDTRARVLGEHLGDYYQSTNKTYGAFPKEHEKYLNTGIKDRIFNSFFNNYDNSRKAENENLKHNINNLRLHETSGKNLYNTKPADYTSIGKRHMYSQDNIPLNADNNDELFKASHDMGKFPRITNNTQTDNYIDKYIPYYKDKEITYWSTNLNKGNMYKSASLGSNAFAKTSGMTQPIQTTKSVNQFSGNTCNNNKSQSVVLNEFDNKFTENYKNELNNQKVNNIYKYSRLI
jgi:hypothetical protein